MRQARTEPGSFRVAPCSFDESVVSPRGDSFQTARVRSATERIGLALPADGYAALARDSPSQALNAARVGASSCVAVRSCLERRLARRESVRSRALPAP